MKKKTKHIVTIELEDNWETTPLEDISYSNVAVAEDGTVAFLDYTENGLCPVTIVDADGSTHAFLIEMPAEDAFVSVAAFDSNKQLIVRDTEGGLYEIGRASCRERV